MLPPSFAVKAVANSIVVLEYIISDCRKGTDSLFAKLCSEDYVQPNFDFNRLEALSESKDTLTLKKGMSREERRAAIMDFANI